MRYLNAKQFTLDHRVEGRDINLTMHDDDKVPLEGDGKDCALQHIQHRWPEEDLRVGVAKGDIPYGGRGRQPWVALRKWMRYRVGVQ